MSQIAKTTLAIADAVLAPPFKQLGLEPFRAALEYLDMRMLDRTTLPRGDGHPVVVFPGLCSDAQFVGPVLSLFEQLGYAACDWGRGLNRGPQGDPELWLSDLAQDIGKMLSSHGKRATLIGWSLGGLYAREVAKHLGPTAVRQVVTVGSPFNGAPEQTNASWLFRLLNGRRPSITDAMRGRLREAPEVPTTSIYSRTDGVVAWQACLQPPASHPCTENIEVVSSHCGMGWNAKVLSILADRLSQPLGRWQPYEAAPSAALSPRAATAG